MTRTKLFGADEDRSRLGDVAEGKVFLDRQGIVKLERGEREPAWSTLLSLAAALGVNLQDFTDIEPAGPAPRGRPRKAPATAR